MTTCPSNDGTAWHKGTDKATGIEAWLNGPTQTLEPFVLEYIRTDPPVEGGEPIYLYMLLFPPTKDPEKPKPAWLSARPVVKKGTRVPKALGCFMALLGVILFVPSWRRWLR